MTTGLRGLVRQPAWRRWALASLVGRLPLTMTLLAFVLVGEHVTGSLARGAQLAGAAVLAAGLSAPLRGRQLDRRGLRDGLRNAALASAAAFTANAVAVVAGAPLPVLFALAIAGGVASAALSGGFRALLVQTVPPEDLPVANTLEAVFIEVSFVAGPSLAGVLALLVGPPGVLVFMAVGSLLAAAAVVTLPPGPRLPDEGSGAPWRHAGARPVYLVAALMGLTFGAVEAALPARAVQIGLDAATAGPLLALTALGSAVGGLYAATRDARHQRDLRIAVVLVGLFSTTLIGWALIDDRALLALVLFAAGAPIAPLNAMAALRLQDVLPKGRIGEGFALFTASILVGAGTGQSLTGLALPALGPRATIVAASVLPLALGAGLAVARLGSGRRDPARA